MVSLPQQLGIPTIVTVSLTTLAAVSTWFIFVLSQPTEWMLFTIAFEGSLLLGGTVLSAIQHLTPGLMQQRSAGTTAALVFLPIVTSFIVFSATSAGVSPDDFDPDFVPLQIIAVLCFLGIAAVLLGVAGYLMLVLPAIWLLRSFVPAKTNTATSPTMGMGRTELAAASFILPATIVFGISMYFIAPDQAGETTRNHMGVQFATFLMGGGQLLPTVGVIGSVAVIVVAGVIYQRAYNQRTGKK